MTDFILYHTSACHLCELAEALLVDIQNAGADLRFAKVDIADDDALMARYGITIPVLRREADGRELNWPFEAHDVMALLHNFDL